MRHRTTDEWIAELQPADIPCGRAGTLADLFDDPYLRRSGFSKPSITRSRVAR